MNGKRVGSHTGGFGAFAFDITNAVHPGNNALIVDVTNENIPDSPPLSADFTFFGGIYRPAELLVMDPVRISPLDHGSPGIRMSTPEVSDDRARVNLKATMQNGGETAADVQCVRPFTNRPARAFPEKIVPVELHAHDTCAILKKK